MSNKHEFNELFVLAIQHADVLTLTPSEQLLLDECASIKRFIDKLYRNKDQPIAPQPYSPSDAIRDQRLTTAIDYYIEILRHFIETDADLFDDTGRLHEQYYFAALSNNNGFKLKLNQRSTKQAKAVSFIQDYCVPSSAVVKLDTGGYVKGSPLVASVGMLHASVSERLPTANVVGKEQNND